MRRTGRTQRRALLGVLLDLVPDWTGTAIICSVWAFAPSTLAWFVTACSGMVVDCCADTAGGGTAPACPVHVAIAPTLVALFRKLYPWLYSDGQECTEQPIRERETTESESNEWIRLISVGFQPLDFDNTLGS